jgi:adenylate cyclase
VNLASRIESLCAVYDVPIVASEETMLDCGGSFGVQYLDTLRVRGRETPVSVFLPMSWDAYAERKQEFVAWMETRALYKKGNFKKAAEAFAVLCSIYPGVRLYAVYLERIRLLLTHPPARWDGVWNMDEKSLYRRWGI